MAFIGNLSGSSRIGITGSVVFGGADPDWSNPGELFPSLGTDVAFYVSGSLGGKNHATDQTVSAFGGDVVVSGTVYVGDDASDKPTTRALSVYANVSNDYAAVIDNDQASSGHVLKLSTDGTGTGSRILEMTDGDDNIHFRSRADGRFGFGASGVSSMGAGTFVVGIDGSHSADIAISKRLQHLGDSDTYMDFTANDQIEFVVGNVDMIHMTEDDSQDIIVFNEGGADVDLRVEGDNDTHLLFVDASADAISIGVSTDAPAALLEIVGDAAQAKPTLSITHAEDTNNAVDITADSVTTSTVINVSADALTTGTALNIDDNSAATGTRSTVNIVQNNAAATGATALTVQSDGNGALPGVKIDKNFTGTASVGNLTTDAAGLLIDYDVTGVAGSAVTQVHDAISVNYNQDAPTNNAASAVMGQGLDIRMTGGTSGTQTLRGVNVVLAGADAHHGIDITLPNEGAHFIARSPDSANDYFKISVAEAGACTLSTSDADGTLAHLTLDAEGDIVLDAEGNNITLKTGGTTALDFVINGATDIKLDAPGDIKFDAGGNDYIFDPAGTESFRLTANGTTSATLDIVGDGIINVDGGQLTVMDDTAAHFLFDCDNTRFTIYDDTAVADYFSVTVAANGAATIATNDNDGTSGDLTLDIDGDIVLDADGGDVLFKDNGTQFLSIANSSVVAGSAFIKPNATGDHVYLGSAQGNIVAHVSSSATTDGYDSFHMDRFFTLGTGVIVSDATLVANETVSVVVAQSTGNVTGTLADPVVEFQFRVVIGMQLSSGVPKVAYTSFGGSTTTKTLTAGTGIILFSLSVGADLRWMLLGDVS